MTDKARRSVLFVALAGVAAWSIWLAINDRSNDDADDRIDVAEPAAHAPRPARATQAPAPVAVRTKPQEAEPRLALSRTNLFPEQTWYVPPPPPPPPPYVPPPPPQAPALPFSYMGRWQEAGHTTYYLARGTAPVSVHAGQVLDGVWRLEPVTGGMLNFTYLPLNQTRSLRTGD
ncbi:hypothetical protein [Thiobacillus sp.]|uniref:hypothetical protein n=1 Tax=Thiobacillus sp. TaxID=924 RepID=UPI001819879C|nr:hypothetical protein [Thiobacillus sp.]MBC2732650.1 hypothetical protein [Thiobacillus sp.]MBC2741387.1 hypothetical protein [Thiobacillus sp.]MBC2759021.1 hypothetical protein [Thiobacillus sp.]